MNYSLPNGKVIILSLEEFLELTDEDIQYLISIDAGEDLDSPFIGSYLKKPIDIPDLEDDSLDIPNE